MPYNGSGVYSLPQAAFVAGTTILSTAANSDFSDIASALTTAYQAALNVGTAQIVNDAVTTVKILNSNVTNAKLADMVQATIKGRAAAAGTGAPVDLTPLQAMTLQSAVRPAFSANKNGTNQGGIAANVATKLTFGTESFDIGNYYDTATSRWTPPAGTVIVYGTINFLSTNLATGDVATSYVYKNGVQYQLGDQIVLYTTTSGILNIALIDIANGTDYYEIWVQLGGVTAGNKIVQGTAINTVFSGVFI